MSTSTDARRFAPLTVGAGTDRADNRLAARALGYAEGLSSGQRAAAARSQAIMDAAERQRVAFEQAARGDVQLALGGLGRAADQLGSACVPGLEDVADMVLEAAVTLARAILGAELAVVDAAALGGIRRALSPLPTDAPVTVRLNPQDVQIVRDQADRAELDDDATFRFEGHEVRLVRDGTLLRGDAVAEQAGSVVDARIEAALARALDSVRATASTRLSAERA
ncbi:FliH/SctL family protein [Angustibacter sp. McL0619]|uniref:FliH/SctL family protein n=1 Tax=Angustibacter sp. McL0619 TaxID=3415676 RepID=UPI003CF46932